MTISNGVNRMTESLLRRIQPTDMSAHGAYWTIFLVLVMLTSFRPVETNTVGSQIHMYQMNDGPRSPGSNVEVASEFTIPCGTPAIIRLYVSNHTSEVVVGHVDHQNCSIDFSSFAEQDFPYLSISIRYSDDRRTHIKWHFTYLPESYNKLGLVTRMYTPFDTLKNQTTLSVFACTSQMTIPTFGQMSMYNIVSTERGYFGDTAECSCLQEDETLFNADGTPANTTAVCAYNALWTGCKNLQCWSAPRSVRISQLKQTVAAQHPFECSFNESFPSVDSIIFKIDHHSVSKSYSLKSSDHGKYLSCEVSSNYTMAMDITAESLPTKIIVHYPPEKSVLSNDIVSIKVNSSMVLNFSFCANPAQGNISLNVKGIATSSSGTILWKENYSQDVLHVYELVIRVSTPADYGIYDVCASTTKPSGTDCSRLAISNTNFQTTRYTPNAITTPIGLGVLIGASVPGFIIIAAMSVGVCIIIRRRRNKNAGNTKETEMQCDDGYAEYQLNDGGRRYEEIGPAPHIYEVAEVNGGYEEVVLRD